MKKFSNISTSKISQDPEKVSKEQNEHQILKVGIIKLMDNYLTIRSYGSARAELLNGALAITGKEMFAEALINLMDDKSLNDQIKSLESLKSYNKDWESIDSRIEYLQEGIDNNQELNSIINQVNKVKSFITLYDTDDRFDSILETYSLRINDPEEAYKMSIASSKMIDDINNKQFKDKLIIISEKFLIRSKDLGFEDGRD